MKLKKLSIITASFFLFALFLTPALASDNNEDGHGGHHKNNDSYTVVINYNEAEVGNMVETKANTGGNWAGGSYGGDGGDGGDIRNRGDEVEESSTGNGGAGGDSGIGGTVMSGDATAETNIMNKVNENDTAIDSCGCEEDGIVDEDGPTDISSQGDDGDWDRKRYKSDDGHVIVFSANRARVINAAGTYANTGHNDADGSYGGGGGDGGDIKNGDDMDKPHGPKPVSEVSEAGQGGQGSHGKDGDDGEVEESSTGKGGAGGSSDAGGLVQSGHAEAYTNVVNMVNRNITRIRR